MCFQTKAQVQPPDLLCVHDTINNYIAIYWNDINPCGADFNAYHIWGANQPQGPFSLIADVVDPSIDLYVHSTPDLQYGAVFYYLTQECNGVVSGPSDTISNTEPSPPSLDYVTVTEDNQVFLSWNMDNYPSYYGSKLFRFFNSGPTFLTNLNGTAANSYLDISAQPGNKVETYDVAARDGCGNAGSFSGNPHSTIHLTIDNHLCDGYFDFEWTPYVGWDAADMLSYKLYKNNDLLATLPATNADLSYRYEILAADTIDLCFRTELENSNGFITSSNRICYALSTPPMPSYLKWKRASVINNEDVELQWYAEAGKSAFFFNIQRGNDDTSLDDILNFGEVNPFSYEMDTLDIGATPNTRFYVYQLEAKDTCVAQVYSDLVKTIFVRGKDNFNLTNTIDWNAYEIGDGTVTSYNIYREDAGFTTPIATVDGSTLTYTDNVDGITAIDSRFCYQVEAIYNLTTPTGATEVLNSLSNLGCISQNSRILVPNIFTPAGNTDQIFKPVIVYPDLDSYRMVIVNRWGEILFETNNPEDGWTGGDQNGKQAPQGVYAYVISMKSLNGIPLEKKGTVTLIR